MTTIWAAIIAGCVGLAGALIGGSFTLAGTREAAEVDALRQERDLRRVAYGEYIDALGEYAAAAASRSETCVAGTDDARGTDAPCQPALDEYEALGEAYRDEFNDIELVGSDEALLLRDAIRGTQPWGLP